MSSNITTLSGLLDGGVLNGFVETDIEKPADGMNGDCIVHFGGKFEKCVLRVKLRDGKREGEGMITNDGVPFMLVEYHDGLLTGRVLRWNTYGQLILEGHARNGLEVGLFVEYDRSEKVAWRGYYRNGKRYSEVVENGRVKG